MAAYHEFCLKFTSSRIVTVTAVSKAADATCSGTHQPARDKIATRIPMVALRVAGRGEFVSRTNPTQNYLKRLITLFIKMPTLQIC
ncbi:hypothetical protein B5X24_HaOG202835 [Helicoverpa armigera]|nr:hypothetical protein B5X24_HaOG202835 [Helicoverpa armigera]